MTNNNQSQVHYARILNSVEPLRKEVDLLESQGRELKVQYTELLNTIQELEKSIEVLKSRCVKI